MLSLCREIWRSEEVTLSFVVAFIVRLKFCEGLLEVHELGIRVYDTKIIVSCVTILQVGCGISCVICHAGIVS